MHHQNPTAAAAAVDDTVIVIVSAALLALAVVLFLLCRKKRRANGDADAEAEAPVLPPYPLADVERATDGFHGSRVLGQGRLYTVYAADGKVEPGLAAKRLHPHLVLGDAGGRRFPPNIRSLSVPRHPNLAALLGYAEGPGERILLVERFPGAVGLDARLHGDTHPPLTWRQRVKAAAGAARGVSHLHVHDIVHGCVQPCNVLIDMSGNAKVCDYGLGCFIMGLGPQERKEKLSYSDLDHNQDCFEIRAESDVYAFGVLLLEVLSGRRCEGGKLVQWALPLIRASRAQEMLDGQAGLPDRRDTRLLARMARVALACVGNDRHTRPGMPEVVTILNDLELAYDEGAIVCRVEERAVWCGGCLVPSQVEGEDALLPVTPRHI